MGETVGTSGGREGLVEVPVPDPCDQAPCGPARVVYRQSLARAQTAAADVSGACQYTRTLRDTAIGLAAAAAALGAVVVWCALLTAPAPPLELLCGAMGILAAVLLVAAAVTLLLLAVSALDLRSKKEECSALRDEMAHRFQQMLDDCPLSCADEFVALSCDC